MLVKRQPRSLLRIPEQPRACWPLRCSVDVRFGKQFTGGCQIGGLSDGIMRAVRVRTFESG